MGKLRLELETRKTAWTDLARLRADMAQNSAPGVARARRNFWVRLFGAPWPGGRQAVTAGRCSARLLSSVLHAG